MPTATAINFSRQSAKRCPCACKEVILHISHARDSKRTFAALLVAAIFATLLTLQFSGSVGASSNASVSGVPSAPAFANSIIHVTTEQYENYAYINPGLPSAVKDRQARQVTETWVQEDEHGVAVKFRSITRLPNGQVVQDQLYDRSTGGELVNFHGWNDTPQSCSEYIALPNPGPAIAVLSADWVHNSGYTRSNNAADLEATQALGLGTAFQRIEQASPSEGGVFTHHRSAEVIDMGNSQELGRFIYGAAKDGSETLLESWVRTPAERLVAVPTGTFELQSLNACRHAPPASEVTP